MDDLVQSELFKNLDTDGDHMGVPQDREGMDVLTAAYASRLSKLDEMRDAAFIYQLKEQLKITDVREPRFAQCRKGDLALLKRMAQDHQHSHKLEARWEGPYCMD